MIRAVLSVSYLPHEVIPMRSVFCRSVWLVISVVLYCFTSSYAQGVAKPAVQKTPEPSAAAKYFSETILTNQNGEKLRFYSDLLKDKVIVINTFFATCQGSCPVMTRNLANLQNALGDRFGKDIYFISITVDSAIDTPASLKAYARKFNAKPDWNFMTGDEKDVDLVLKKIGQYVEQKADHLNIFVIGNERTGLWKKAFGLAKSEELLTVVESVLNDKVPAKTPAN